MNYKNIKLKCAKCGGPKFAGEEYYFAGTYYVDITCLACADSKDIKVSDFENFLKLLKHHKGNRGNAK